MNIFTIEELKCLLEAFMVLKSDCLDNFVVYDNILSIRIDGIRYYISDLNIEFEDNCYMRDNQVNINSKDRYMDIINDLLNNKELDIVKEYKKRSEFKKEF